MGSNLHLDQLLDLAYQLAKENYHDKQFTFSMIWSKTWKSAQDFKKESVENWIGIFYTSLQLDPRFVKYHNNTIRLKEFISYTEYKKLDKSSQGEDVLLEEDFEKTPSKKSKEKIVETEEDEDDGGDSLERLLDSET